MNTDRSVAATAWLEARGAGADPHTGRTLAVHLRNVQAVPAAGTPA